MSKQPAVPHGVMEGMGAYNKYARLTASGGALAMPFLEKAVSRMAIEAEGRPIVIADYGSSQGKNSLAPIGLAIEGLRARVAPNHPLVVFHIDQPSNDFNSLFQVLSSDPDRYSIDEPYVFPCAIGRSFYESVLPADSVHLGWCSYAAVWLSRIPALIPGHFVPIFSTGAVRLQFDRQAATDWKTFLSLRASELKPGGRLIIVLPAIADNGLTGFEEIMNQANAAIAELVDEGAITAEERARMVLGTHPRRKEDLLAPFENGEFHGLRVEDCELLSLPDAAWLEYQKDGDAEALATKQALFFRAVFVPSLASALGRVRVGDAQAIQDFSDRLYDRLKTGLIRNPTAMDSFIEVIVVAKQVR
jgi:hypothetical protein